MKNLFTKTFLASCMVACYAFASPFGTVAQNPAYPANLKADVNGTKVDLSWTRSIESKELLSTGFEGTTFPEEGWEQQIMNSSDYKCSWFHYPTDEVKQNMANWGFLINSGDASAVVMWDSGYHEDVSYMQDEWLITPVVPNAAYLDFYCFINASALLDYGQYEEFPDHYMVKLSQDGGATWETLWDARYDAVPIDEWQQVSIPLGQTGENTRIAFEALGDQDPTHDVGLYFTWAIDDIVISSSEAASQAARQKMLAKERKNISKLVTNREFTPEDNTKVSRPAKAPQKVSPIGYYNLYLDDMLLAGYLNTMEYTDLTEKDPGNHTYKVTYFDALTDSESEGTKLDVVIPVMPFNPPRNLQISWYIDDRFNSYATNITWEAPEGDREPAYYNVYRDETQIAYEYPDFEFGQTMMPKGVFKYSVSAHYMYPTRDSELVSDIIAIEVRYPVMNLNATVENSDVVVKWDAPKTEEGYELASYSVYRGNTCLVSETTETTYKDSNVPNGTYEYSVIAAYTNGEKAVRQTARAKVGETYVYSLPYSESFDGGMTPDNWAIVSNSTSRANYSWRFDNFYELPTTGGGFSNEFASVNTLNSGYTFVESQLCTPLFSTAIEDGQSLILEFDIDYLSNVAKDAELQTCVNGETNWVTIETLPSYKKDALVGDETCKPQHVKYDLTDYIHGETMSIGWYYMAQIDGYLSIDNVKVYAHDNSGVENVVVEKIVESVTYIDLLGRKVVKPENGLYIKTTIYNDGSFESKKVNVK